MVTTKYIIKKYENRKYYDSTESAPTTLEKILKLSNKYDVLVIDYNGKDITLPTLFDAANTVLKQRFILGHIKGKDFKFLKSSIAYISEVLI